MTCIRPGCLKGWNYSVSLSGLSVMHTTFWLNACSIIKLLSFSSTFGERFSRVAADFVCSRFCFVYIFQADLKYNRTRAVFFFFFFFFCKGSEKGSVGHRVSVVPIPSCVLAVPDQPQIQWLCSQTIYKIGARLDLDQWSQFAHSCRAFSITKKCQSQYHGWKWPVHSSYYIGL